MPHLWLWVLVVLVLWQWPYLHQFYHLLTHAIRPHSLEPCDEDAMDAEAHAVLEPYLDYLAERGFIRLATFRVTAPPESTEAPVHLLYFYCREDGVYAALETAPYPGALQPAFLRFFTLFQSGHSCHTANGVRHFVDYEPEEAKLCDHYLADWREILPAHLRDREIEGEVVRLEPKSPAELLADGQKDFERSLQAREGMGLITKTQDGYRYRPSWKLWRMARRIVDGQRRFARALKQAARKNPDNAAESTDALLARMKVLAQPKRNRKKAWTWLGLSATLFFGLFILLGLPVVAVIALMMVLLIHELGHWAAMRALGYEDVSIFFLPFGAATKGRKEARNAFEEYVVLVMGPLPGLLIGEAILLYLAADHQPWLAGYAGEYALLSLLLNFINLLPVFPLDGGRIVQLLLLSGSPRAQFYFYLFSLTALAAATLALRDPLLLILVAALAVGYRQNRAATALMQKLMALHPGGGVTLEQVAEVLTRDPSFARLSLPAKAALGRRVGLTLRTQRLGPAQSVVFFLFYLLLLLGPAASLMALALRS